MVSYWNEPTLLLRQQNRILLHPPVSSLVKKTCLFSCQRKGRAEEVPQVGRCSYAKISIGCWSGMERLEWQNLLCCVLDVVVHRMDPLLRIRRTGSTYNGSTSQPFPQNLHTVIPRLAESRFIRTFAEERSISGSEFNQCISNTVYGYIQDWKYNRISYIIFRCHSNR